MKYLFLHIFLVTCLGLKSQDKMFMTDGSCKTVKVLEIAPETITFVELSESGAPFVDANETVPKNEVLLIEYKSGFVEVYTIPQKTTVYNANGTLRKQVKKDGKEEQEFAFNFASLNTLALCNADISLFFEHLIPSKKIGLGLMGAYNFNPYVISPNSFIARLNNAKKNYDVGVFVNFYPGHFKRQTTFYFGALFKYTDFSFSKIIEDNSGSSLTIKYTPAKGSQMATLVDVGTHTTLGKNFFFKTLFAVGGFKLRGDYKQQFNYLINRDRRPTDPMHTYNFLPKLYLAINFGFNF